MSEKVDNPILDIPVEFEEGQMSNATDDEEDETSLEELAAEIERRASVKEPNDVNEPAETKPVVEEKKEEEGEVDPRFVDKTTEEMIDIYKNVEKLAKSHDTELGELRKELKDFKEKEEQTKNLNLHEIEKKIMPTIEGWTVEEKTVFFEEFNANPDKALGKLFKTFMQPYARRQATSVAKEEIDRLKGLHKEHVVPYTEKDINALISANQNWWKKYGTGIYEHAYNIIRNRDFDKYAAIRNQRLQAEKDKQASEEDEAKTKTFVERNAPARIVLKGKEITLEQLKAADPESAMSAIEKILKARGVPVNV